LTGILDPPKRKLYDPPMPALPSDATLRIAIVGCGEISGQWFRALANRPDASVVALIDLNPEVARRRRDEFGLSAARVGTDLSATLEEVRPDIVFDCTVPAARASVVETALHRGCHVLSEKPMAAGMDEARQLLEAARAAGRTFAVMQNRRYLPAIRRLRAFVAADSIGGLTTLNSDFYIGAHFGGFRQQMRHVLLLDMAIHSFDQARFIADADPVSVYCREWNPHGSWYAHDASAIAIFQMSGGIVYTYRGSWCAEGLSTSWECDWRAIGTGGSASWNGGDALRAERPVAGEGLIRPTAEVAVPAGEWNSPEGHAGCIHHFLDCVRAGRVPETDGSDNIKSLAMVFAAIESAETDRSVAIKI
jgi:predicted dehydrogenase